MFQEFLEAIRKDNKTYPYVLRADAKQAHDVREWCLTTYGEEGSLGKPRRWRTLNDYTFIEIKFRNEEDAALFKLSWC